MTLRLFDKLTSLIYQGRQIPVTVKSTRVYMIEHALNAYYCVTLQGSVMPALQLVVPLRVPIQMFQWKFCMY